MIDEIKESLDKPQTRTARAFIETKSPIWLRYLLDELEKAKKENATMKEALEWYADEENYKRTEEDYQSGYPHEIMWDKGLKARHILSTLSKEESQ